MGPLGYQEMVFIFILALLLFGPKKLPELGRTLGKALTEFRRASNELKSTFEREMKTLERETESIKEVANSYQYETYNYDYSSYESGAPDLGYQQPAIAAGTTDSTATYPSTNSASATQGAESHTAAGPEGVVAHGSETVAVSNGSPASPAAVSHPVAAVPDKAVESPTVEHKA